MLYAPKYPEYSTHDEGEHWVNKLKARELLHVWKTFKQFFTDEQIRSILYESKPLAEYELELMKEMKMELSEIRCIVHDAEILGLIKRTQGDGNDRNEDNPGKA
jgi:hypothetical protein